MFPSSTKREIRHIHVVVVQWRQTNVQKRRDERAELLFCQCNLLLFCRSRWRHRHRCLSSLLPLRKIGERGYINPWGKHWREGRRWGEKYISPGEKYIAPPPPPPPAPPSPALTCPNSSTFLESVLRLVRAPNKNPLGLYRKYHLYVI